MEYVQIKDVCNSVIIDKTIQCAGIYALYNVVNNKIYVGSSNNMYQRTTRHLGDLKNGKHYNRYLIRTYNKYVGFLIPVVLECVEDKSKLIEKEQYWIDYFKSYDRELGYNICRIADRLTGIRRTDEEKKHLSIINTGRKASEETKKK